MYATALVAFSVPKPIMAGPRAKAARTDFLRLAGSCSCLPLVLPRALAVPLAASPTLEPLPKLVHRLLGRLAGVLEEAREALSVVHGRVAGFDPRVHRLVASLVLPPADPVVV